ncbi:hypothetical protein SmJEL517_g04616 [Synchytrium microbalum]|uniref:WW domain-containing protein n=1 Tax=Synchytrium microbalum TaxID=1806994 RepID=A0A507C3P7_9FUNG|nr:uncharacterized protein SmJEL517_g04616 [Synchytrium microbalum]TPX32185.1 hypothetical protein SmJEL517_g04616 [Synchytrium microbalum]
MASLVLDEEYDEDYEPSDEEILEYAQFLGMDVEKEKDLFWIARESLKAPLPPNWKPCSTDDNTVYYFNFTTGESLWDHPCDEHYRKLYETEKNKKAGKAAEAPKVQPKAADTKLLTKQASDELSEPQEIDEEVEEEIEEGDDDDELDLSEDEKPKAKSPVNDVLSSAASSPNAPIIANKPVVVDSVKPIQSLVKSDDSLKSISPKPALKPLESLTPINNHIFATTTTNKTVAPSIEIVDDDVAKSVPALDKGPEGLQVRKGFTNENDRTSTRSMLSAHGIESMSSNELASSGGDNKGLPSLKKAPIPSSVSESAGIADIDTIKKKWAQISEATEASERAIHESSLESLRESLVKSLQQEEDVLKKQHQQRIVSLRAQFEADEAALAQSSKDTVNKLKEDLAKTLDEIQCQHAHNLEAAKTQHTRVIETAKREVDAQIESIKADGKRKEEKEVYESRNRLASLKKEAEASISELRRAASSEEGRISQVENSLVNRKSELEKEIESVESTLLDRRVALDEANLQHATITDQLENTRRDLETMKVEMVTCLAEFEALKLQLVETREAVQVARNDIAKQKEQASVSSSAIPSPNNTENPVMERPTPVERPSVTAERPNAPTGVAIGGRPRVKSGSRNNRTIEPSPSKMGQFILEGYGVGMAADIPDSQMSPANLHNAMKDATGMEKAILAGYGMSGMSYASSNVNLPPHVAVTIQRASSHNLAPASRQMSRTFGGPAMAPATIANPIFSHAILQSLGGTHLGVASMERLADQTFIDQSRDNVAGAALRNGVNASGIDNPDNQDIFQALGGRASAGISNSNNISSSRKRQVSTTTAAAMQNPLSAYFGVKFTPTANELTEAEEIAMASQWDPQQMAPSQRALMEGYGIVTQESNVFNGVRNSGRESAEPAMAMNVEPTKARNVGNSRIVDTPVQVQVQQQPNSRFTPPTDIPSTIRPSNMNKPSSEITPSQISSPQSRRSTMGSPVSKRSEASPVMRVRSPSRQRGSPATERSRRDVEREVKERFVESNGHHHVDRKTYSPSRGGEREMSPRRREREEREHMRRGKSPRRETRPVYSSDANESPDSEISSSTPSSSIDGDNLEDAQVWTPSKQISRRLRREEKQIRDSKRTIRKQTRSLAREEATHFYGASQQRARMEELADKIDRENEVRRVLQDNLHKEVSRYQSLDAVEAEIEKVLNKLRTSRDTSVSRMQDMMQPNNYTTTSSPYTLHSTSYTPRVVPTSTTNFSSTHYQPSIHLTGISDSRKQAWDVSRAKTDRELDLHSQFLRQLVAKKQNAVGNGGVSGRVVY